MLYSIESNKSGLYHFADKALTLRTVVRIAPFRFGDLALRSCIPSVSDYDGVGGAFGGYLLSQCMYQSIRVEKHLFTTVVLTLDRYKIK